MSRLKLPHLTSAQFEEIEYRAKPSGVHPDVCPTCDSKADEYGERENGSYTLDGDIHKCVCQEQIDLRKHYLLANIPDQFMTLRWPEDYTGDEKLVEGVAKFLDNWPGFKRYGMGFEIAGTLGVGKTFAATTIGRELVKRGEDVFFLPFNQMLDAMRHQDRRILDRLHTTNVVILDEILPPPNDSLKSVMANHLESIVRNRTNYNAVTILTTNLSARDMEALYPRTYSLLAAKQIRVEVQGEDARKSVVSQRNLSRLLNGERVPIS